MDETREPWEGTRDDAVFKFQRFAEDGQRAVFRYSPEACLTKDYLDTVFESLRNQDLQRNMLEKPFHVVQIRKQVNDTYLPDLIVDDGEQTVTLDWRRLFAPFFGEEKRSNLSNVGVLL